MKAEVIRVRGESGQAVLMVILAMSIFLLGAVGLAVDGAHLFAQRQMAQAAADAAAQAAVMSMFNSTNTSGAHSFPTTPFTCAASDPQTPCYYAQQLNGFGGASDTVTVDFPSTTQVGVTVSRSVPTTLIRFLGPSASTISARGVAAIENIPSAIPIIITHPGVPTKGGDLSFNGNPNITIIGGPSRSIQVNSGDSGAIDTTSCGNATVDLHQAGPDHKGADFGNHGGPSTPCFSYNFGIGSYVDPASPILDPLASVPVPSPSGLVSRTDPPPASQTVSAGTNGCVRPCTNSGCATTCPVYYPGLYANGITIKDAKANGVALFAPGLYYISSGGFNMQSNSAARMATGLSADPLYPEIGSAGMVVFNTGTQKADIFNFDANAGALSPILLNGAPTDSIWAGILFYEDPTPNGGSHTGLPSGNPGHQIWGAGTVSLTGTVYISTRSGVTSTSFQNVALGGGGGSNTTVTGEIIVNTLSLGGNGSINMILDSTTRLVKQVALIQ